MKVNKTSLFPNFNFNVSHAGDYVILGSEPHDLIGVDVMDANRPINTTVPEFFKNMQGCFTPFEWRTIKEGTNESHQIKQFFVHWTLKEGSKCVCN
jgi:4'-phosphopantetheinyl transferase